MNKRKIITILSIIVIFLVVIFSVNIVFKNGNLLNDAFNLYRGNTIFNSAPSVTIVKYGADW